jgi:lactoylglutathione lyase
MQLKLIVLRTADQKALADFYTLLGLNFDYHKHGNSPYHYSAHIGETVLEIYPLTKTQTGPDKDLRLGFALDNFEAALSQIEKLQFTILMPPAQTEWGFMAIVQDPDGRKIELYKNH